MAIPPWTIELLRRGLSDVARKASEPETLEKIKTQATEILQDLPQTAARGIDAVMRTAEAGKKSVQRWSRKHTALSVPMLNASGVLIHEFGTGVPLSDDAIEVGHELLTGDSMGGDEFDQRIAKRLERLLPSGGDYAIAITSNFPSALTAFSLLVGQRQLVVHRKHAVRLPGGQALPDAFGMLMPVIQEVGSVNEIAAGDFAGLDRFCAIMADGGDTPVQLLDFGDQDAMQAVVLPIATVTASADDQIPSAESVLGAGADFVIMSGGGVCGGPDCGILIGRVNEIERICASTAWPAVAASDAIRAMLTVTLEAMAADPERVPIHALLRTTEENLKGRAERLAIRLGASDSIASCQVATSESRLVADGRWRFPSRQLRLRHATKSSEAWHDELLEELPAIVSVVEGTDLCLDLRWISPADDGKLAEALIGQADATGGGREAESSEARPQAPSEGSPAPQ